MQKSIKKNYIYNLINTISSLLFPILTFPYASRIMMAEGIGLVNFYQSIIQYISLIASLGIPLYAVREIGKVRNNIELCSKTALEILVLHLILTLTGYLLVIILSLTTPQIQANIPLFLILSLTLVFTAIGCEWFYQGIEDFKYITIRGLIIKSAAIIYLFIFVKSADDILLYGIYCVVGVLGGNIYNFIRLKKYISRKSLKGITPLKHLKPALKIFFLNLIISLYINLNSVMLGFIKGTEDVGYFTAATRLSQMILGISGALSTVMLPRLSNLIANNLKLEFNQLAQKGTRFIIALTLPLSIGCYFIAPYIIPIFCGDSYHDAIITLQIISPIIFFIGLSNIIGIQILYPQQQESKVILCTGIGAITNIILNIILIPEFGHKGAAISTLCAEAIVTISMALIGKYFIPINWNDKTFFHYYLSSFIMIISLATVEKYIYATNISKMFLIIFIGCITYFAILFIVKDSLLKELKHFIKK